VRPPLFPTLDAEAPLADVQVRQTLAMGLLPLGLALLLMAAGAPEWPSAGLWAGVAAALGGMALVAAAWRRSGHRHLRGFSTVHFFVRYGFFVLCLALLWIVFGGIILDLAGFFPPLLLGLLLLIYPAGRILHEIVGPDPRVAPHLEMAHIVCQQTEIVLGVLSLAGVVSGAIVDAQRDYPTDPTPVLIVVWLLALLALLVSVVLAVAHWSRLFGRIQAPQPLDDEPPPAGDGKTSRFGSDRF